jgi:16S rRNA C967 or C1407 C5-methylase (RsmB/RsmF family)
MIPPVVLDVKPRMTVLDMCAAPGSKTCQLVEVVGGFGNRDIKNDNDENNEQRCREPEGYVIANDADAKRAYMLVTQLRRLRSPSVFVTSCDGQYFPILDSKEDRGTEREGMFDRVLCDVPCSGK